MGESAKPVPKKERKPTVIRKKAQANSQDLADYIAGANLLKRCGKWDQYVQIHWQCMARNGPPGGVDPAHGGAGFFPWHRQFLLLLEKDIQTALGKPNFALPYWDWASDSDTGNPAGQFMWTASCMGEAGTPVTTGPFKQGSWSPWQPPFPPPPSPQLPPPNLFGSDSGDLSRRLSGFLPNQALVTQALGNPQYTNFERAAESLHNSVHGWVGGDMVQASSPNDPAFFLHHCNMDRLWAIWQSMNPNAPYPASGQPRGQNLNDAMWPWSTTPARMLQYTSLGYTYDDGVIVKTPSAIQIQNRYFFTAANNGGLGTGHNVAIRTDTRTIGPNEKFRIILVDSATGQFALQTPDGRHYVTAVGNGGKGGPNDSNSPIHTDTQRLGGWETFVFERQPDGCYAIRTTTGYYFSAVNGGGWGEGPNQFPVHTDAGAIGGWETFKLVQA